MRVPPDLLDAIRLGPRRQDWYRASAAQTGEEEKAFVESAALGSGPELVAHDVQQVLGFGPAGRVRAGPREEALRLFIERTEAAGVLVLASGIVGPNARRTLDANEFRGFALSDPMAPLGFANSPDAEAGRMFTPAHELGPLRLGKSAASERGHASRQ